MDREISNGLEKWKDVKGFEGLYRISNKGNVLSIGKRTGNKGTGNYNRENRLLKQTLNNSGYMMVDLYKSGRRHYRLVHRLVAEAFIENADNFTDVNHKDENRSNNCAENLEWCTHKYNMNYGMVKEKIGKSNGIPVVQKDLYGKIICTYESAMDAQRKTGIRNSDINDCCRKPNVKTAGGYIWEYAI